MKARHEIRHIPVRIARTGEERMLLSAEDYMDRVRESARRARMEDARNYGHAVARLVERNKARAHKG